MGIDPYIGEISIFAGNYAPAGWRLCDGSLLPIAQYQALYAVIGNYYGGDGRTNFALPDLRGRAPLGTGAGTGLTARALGSNGGAETVGLSGDSLPVHNHPAQSSITGAAKFKAAADSGNAALPGGAYIASHQGAFIRSASGTLAELNPGSIDVSALQVSTSVSNAGNGRPHENMPPFLALNYIIAVEGVFPPRE